MNTNFSGLPKDDFIGYPGCLIHCFKRTALALVLSVVGLFMTISSNAAIVLTLNTDDKTFALTGSDTGALHEVLPSGAFNLWEVAVPDIKEAVPGTYVSYNNDVAFTTDLGSPGNGFLWDIHLSIQFESVILKIGTSSAGAQTITGTGVFQSYDLLSPGFTDQIESAIGQLLVDESTEAKWPSIAVVGIPEPAASSTVLGAAALIGMLSLFYRKRRRLGSRLS